MKNKFDHITSIHKSLSGQITVEEQQQLDQWLLADPANKVIAQEVAMIWRAADAYRKAEGFNMEGALTRLHKARAAELVEVAPHAIVKSLPLRRYFLRAAVAAGFFFGLFFLFSEMGNLGTNELAVVNTSLDQKEEAKLEDGSTVYINEATVFEYPDHFEKNARKVKLKGEAFFEIAKDAARPFIIATNQLDVKVLGTSFNVYAYPDKTTEEVSVSTGKVSVNVKQNNKEYILEAGDYLSYNKQNGKVTLTKDSKQNAQAWKTGVLTFGATPLSTVCQVLEKHFAIHISIENKELLNCPVTVPSFKNANQEIVLETLKTVFSMELKETATDHFQFSGGACQ